MRAEGQLTEGGLLYEGNLSEWSNRMEALFNFHNIQWTILWEGRCEIKQISNAYKVESGDASFVHIVRAQVSPHLLCRVSHDYNGYDFGTVGHLATGLKKVARPFRLMDLPTELRVRICSLAIISEKPNSATGYKHRLKDESDLRFRIDKLHAIVRTSIARRTARYRMVLYSPTSTP